MPLSITDDIKELAKDFKENYNLTDYESLSLAFKREQNELLKIGFVISSYDDTPTGLEAIAKALGFVGRI